MGNKKNINDFQKALLSNTKIIGKENNELTENNKSMGEDVKINPEIIEKYKALAEKHNLVSYTNLMEIALNHFLDLEGYWFDETLHV